MQLENEFSVPAPVSEVWKTLLDVERIAPCMPGATVERVDGDEVAGRVRVKVGPVTASYAGTARFVTKDEAAHRFVLEGNGRETRGTGTASATVEVSMSEQDAVTRVRVVTSLEVTGKQAQRRRHAGAEAARPGARRPGVRSRPGLARGPSPPDRDHDRGGAGLVPARANRALDRGVTPRRCARC